MRRVSRANSPKVVKVSEESPGSSFRELDDVFLQICRILGLTGIDLFSPSDVVEKRDIRRVCMCVRSFSKKARSKGLSVPDFDIVKYTIAMPTDIVGGICRSLEQSRCSSSSSSYSMDFRRVYGKKGGNAHHDHNHENGYESDEAESRYNELEFESSSPHASFRAADMFNFDPEGYPQRRDLLCKEFTDTYHANEATSDWSYISGSLSTSESAEHFNNFLACAPRESGDECFSDRSNFSCPNPGILAKLKGDISSEKDLEIEDGAHFIKDVGTITNHINPDNTEERKKIMKDHEDNLMATSTLSKTRVENTGKRVFKSLAGSISLIGALLVFLQLRNKRDKESSSHTVVPLPHQQTYQEVSTNNKVEIINYHKRYPGERLKL